MKTKLKYLKLFEGISPSDIPYSYRDGVLYIDIQTNVKELPEIYNELTNEIDSVILIQNNSMLETINSFNNLTEIGRYIEIFDNPKLTQITGFSNLTKIGDYISIHDNPNLTHIPGFSNLTEIDRGIFINFNPNLTHITGFDNLTKIGGYISILGNKNLTYITGFDNLTKHGGTLCVRFNPKLISMSIPYTIIKSVDYVESGIYYTSPVVFINHPNIVNECIDKFDPAIHPDVVVKQIIENLEFWGEPKTIKTIINHILSKDNYWEYIPEQFYEYVDDHYHHLYNAKYANTGARGIAKMNTGRYLGMF